MSDDPEASLRMLCPELPWLLKQLGASSVPKVVEQWVNHRGDDWVNQLLSTHITGNAIAEKWDIQLDRRPTQSMILIEELIFEYLLSYRAAYVAPNLQRRFQYDKTLHICRQYVAICLYDEAREVNWRRPFIFTRALKLSHAYLRDLKENSDLTNPDARYQFEGRLGVAIILIARFETVPEDELREAVEVLLSSIELGNPVSDAVPYVLEGMIRLYDLCGEIHTLQRAVTLDRKYGSDVLKSAAWHLNMSEIWLRLADEATTAKGQQGFLYKALERVGSAKQTGLFDSVDKARYHIASALCRALSQFPMSESVRPLGTRGLKNPFGLYEHLAELNSPTGASVSAIDTVVDTLRSATAFDTEPIVRRVLADALSARALDTAIPVRQRISLLQEALHVRHGPGRFTQLDDEPSRFQTIQDHLLLARLQGDEAKRVNGLKLLVMEAVSDASACIPLVILGQDLEANGPLSKSAGVELKALLSRSPDAQPIAGEVCSNRVDSVYAEAARRAILSPDLSRRRLGGRGNAMTTEDYLRLSNDVFVFKATTRACYERELARTKALTSWIKERELDDVFGFVEHLAQTEADRDDPMFSTAANVLTVRRFGFGSTLADAIGAQPDLAPDLLTLTCRFLALIHSFETNHAGQPTGTRRDLLKKEFGWWLRDGLRAEDTAEIFATWWDEVAGVPLLSRRDAHAFNWLFSGTDRVLAIDLEATGWRPAGYELAQLTDDVPALPVSDSGWSQRKQIVELYVSTLMECGYNSTSSEIWRAYTASLVARAVRGLTDPAGDGRLRSHAEELLRSIVEETTVTSQCQILAKRILDAWARRRGISVHQLLPRIGEGRRRHISRTLSYYLRHDHNVLADEAGWVSSETLSEAFRAAGLRVSASEILSVASAVDETRFEVRDSQVRARYGHSRRVEIDYESPTPPTRLYHATTMATLNAIFQQRQGLMPMERQWVHLSARWDLALRAGRRHGPPALLEVTPEDSALTLFNAGGTTWLARAVDPQALHVTPIFRIFLWDHMKR